LPRAGWGFRGRSAAPRAKRFDYTIRKERLVSANGVRERPHDYAVVWRAGNGPTSSGRLQLGDDELVLNGAAAPDGLRIPLADLSSVEIGRAPADRVNGEKSLVLERRSCERVLVAALGGVGLLGELNDLSRGTTCSSASARSSSSSEARTRPTPSTRWRRAQAC